MVLQKNKVNFYYKWSRKVKKYYKYKKDDINPICGKTFGYLLQKTIEKEKRLKELGYNVVSIWESEY